MFDAGEIHLIETHEERLVRIAMSQEKWNDKVTRNEVTSQIKETQKLGAIIPVWPNGNHRESSVPYRRSASFCKESHQPRLPSARVSCENDEWLCFERSKQSTD